MENPAQPCTSETTKWLTLCICIWNEPPKFWVGKHIYIPSSYHTHVPTSKCSRLFVMQILPAPTYFPLGIILARFACVHPITHSYKRVCTCIREYISYIQRMSPRYIYTTNISVPTSSVFFTLADQQNSFAQFPWHYLTDFRCDIKYARLSVDVVSILHFFLNILLFLCFGFYAKFCWATAVACVRAFVLFSYPWCSIYPYSISLVRSMSMTMVNFEKF